MIPVSPEFQAAQDADSAAPAYLINLVLPDYAATAAGATVTSSGDADADQPAAGAINSDHTEINIGAASVADNGVGRSSWKSSASPDGSGNVWMVVDFGQSRKFHRVKLYNLASDPLTSYLLQYWDGAAWVDFAGTNDKFPPPGGGYAWGTGGYGYGPYGGTSGWPGVGPTGGLDVYDFGAITSTKIRLLVYATQSAGPAQLVELEVYRLVDITSRCYSISTDKKKDFKLSQPIASQEVIGVHNTDRFFSPSYVPTVAEVAAGFVNPELKLLGVNLEVNEGFYTTGGIELLRTFTGSVDSITPVAGTADAEIVARDGTKGLIDQQDSCRLKTAVDIADCLRYVLNRNGISDYEMTLATTTIVQPYFFYYESSILTVVQELVQASGDALFYFDESGQAILNYFLGATPQQGEFNNATAWATGSLTNIDNTQSDGSIRREWFLITDFADGFSNPAWNVIIDGHGGNVFVSGGWTTFTSDGADGSNIRIPFSQAYGTWQFDVRVNPGANVDYLDVWLMWNTVGGAGYLVKIRQDTGECNLVRDDAVLISGSTGGGTAPHTVRVTRASNGEFALYIDGVLQGTNTDASHTTSTHILILDPADDVGNVSVTNLYFSNVVLAPAVTATNAQAVWISPSIDRGADLSQNGILNLTTYEPAGASVLVYTAASLDNVNWDAWTQATPGQQDPCAVKRYEKVKLVLACPEDDGLHNAVLTTPVAYALTVAWWTGVGQQKWSPQVDFYLTDENGICDISEQISDSLAGDTSIINDVAVTAAPLVLTGADTDDQWQAVTGTPPDKVSAANPLVVSAGAVVYNPVISGGMDIANMAGGTCIAITWGTATGTAAITYIHPTKPVLTLTVTNPGTITDLRLIGKGFSNLQTPYQSLASDATSIARHRKRHTDLNNNYFRDGLVCDVVAARTIANQKDPTSHVPNMPIFPPRVNMQPGDRVNVVNEITGIAQDYYNVGYSRKINISDSSADVSMELVLMRVPIA